MQKKCNRVTMIRYEEMVIYKKQFNDLILDTFGIHDEEELLRNMNIYHETKMNVTIDTHSHIAFFIQVYFLKDMIIHMNMVKKIDMIKIHYIICYDYINGFCMIIQLNLEKV